MLSRIRFFASMARESSLTTSFFLSAAVIWASIVIEKPARNNTKKVLVKRSFIEEQIYTDNYNWVKWASAW
jgi:hypothetical protein